MDDRSDRGASPDPRDESDGAARKQAGEASAPTTPGKAVTAAVGATAGAVTAGSVATIFAGPIGTIVAGIAGAIGGAWLGLAEGTTPTPDVDREDLFRAHYERHPNRPADVPYERVRPAYQLGAFAARNPDYAGRPFSEIEGDLRRGWGSDIAAAHGDWRVTREYARAAYEGDLAHRMGETFADPNLGGSASHQRASYSDPIPTYVNPADSATGQDVAGSRDISTHDEDPWLRDPVDQGGFGHHVDPSLRRESDDDRRGRGAS